MEIQREKLFLHPWDMKVIARYGGLRGFLDAEERHRNQTAMPFLPSVHQAADLLCSWENDPSVEKPWTRFLHNRALRRLYQVSNSPAVAYRTAFFLKRDKTCRVLHIPDRDLKKIQRRILSKIHDV